MKRLGYIYLFAFLTTGVLYIYSLVSPGVPKILNATIGVLSIGGSLCVGALHAIGQLIYLHPFIFGALCAWTGYALRSTDYSAMWKLAEHNRKLAKYWHAEFNWSEKALGEATHIISIQDSPMSELMLKYGAQWLEEHYMEAKRRSDRRKYESWDDILADEVSP